MNDPIAPIAQGFRLSPHQRRLWLLQRGEAVPPYRCHCALRIHGRLDHAALASALADVVAAQEILRTGFPSLPGLTLPLQVIRDPQALTLREVTSGEAVDIDAALARLGREDGPGGAFDLASGDVLRAALAPLGAEEHLLLLALPALCADAATFDHLAAGLLAAYARRVGGGEAEAPLQFADVAEWQNQMLESEDTAEGVNRWREAWRNQGIGEILAERLPFESPAQAPGFAPAAVTVLLEEPLVAPGDLERLLTDPRLGGATPADLFLAAWQIVLWRSTGSARPLVGVLHDGRGYEELRTALGPLAHHLPVTAALTPGMSFAEAVQAAASAAAEAAERQEHFGWEPVAGWKGGFGEPGFFPAAFEPLAEPREITGAGLRITPEHLDCRGERFTVALAAGRRGSALAAQVLYDAGRVQRADAERLAGRLAALLRAAATRPEAALGDLDVLAPGERDLVLTTFAHGPAVPAEHIAATLHQRFEEQADRTPERAALVWDGEETTYRELDRRANRLAWHLKALGVVPETPVALCLERSSIAIEALIGILKAGGAYVPLDPSHPAERLEFILRETGTPLVVTERRLAGVLPDVHGVRPLLLDAEAEAIAARPGDRLDSGPESGVGPRNLAYVIYTSGSTGKPKGVLIEHRSPLNLLAGLEAAVYTPACRPAPLRASQNAPLIFDASVQQLVLLLAGHTLVVVPEEVRSDGKALLAFLREQRVDAFDCTPSQLRLLVSAGLLTAEGAPALVLAAGEAVDPALWEALAGSQKTVFHNIYGPTECTVDATAHRIGPDSGAVPAIGRPLAGYTVHLLDPDLHPVPVGAPGEICISGAGLARGYARRPETTAERFVPDPWGKSGGRLYRTGDLARWRAGGEIEFLGRGDQQVKIRGYRIEPGEIEAALARHPWVSEAAVAAHPGPGDSPLLVAYAVPGPGAPADPGGATAELQAFLRERLPAYMVPAVFMLLSSLPRTPSGKVDRRALPAPDLRRRGPGTDYAPPETAVEQLLAAIWEDLLGVSPVGLHDSFFDLGGHSLLATQVISRVREALHLDLPVRHLFDGPTVGELAQAVEAARAGGSAAQAPPIVPVPRNRDLPLSFGQQRLWFLQQLDPGSHAYNTPFALRLSGRLDTGALAWTLEQVVRRHETLRTTFRVSGGEPVQVIAPPCPQPLPSVDLSALPPAVGWGEAQRLTAAEARTPFDLSRPPAVRLRLLRLTPGEHVLLFTIHHVSGDGWSVGVLTREVAELYAACTAGRAPDLPALPVQYADFAVWQREWLQGEALEAQIAYWRERLASAPPFLELPTDRPRPPVPGDRSGRVAADLPETAWKAAEELGRREGATPFMILLATCAILLQRYSGQDTVVIGTPIANRNRHEIEGLIGFFANTLALRTDLGDDPTFRALLRRVRENALGAYAHQDLPFEKLVDELQPPRDMSHAPVFQVMLVHQGPPGEPLTLGDVGLSAFGSDAPAARYDLTLTCAEMGGGLGCGIDFSTDLFDPETARRMLRLFNHLVVRAAGQPDRPISELPLLDEIERSEVLVGWNGTRRELAAEDTCLHQLFESGAARAPEAPALLWQGETVTYGELDRRAEELARRLRASGVGPEVRVGLACERSPGALAGILGVLKAGGAYVPLDPEAPRERLEAIAADAGLAVLLTQERFAGALAGLAPALLQVDAEPFADGAPLAPAPAISPTSPDNAAYVVYTSGSTGAAKGVIATHRNAVNFVLGLADSVGAGPGDRFFLFAPLSFDASVLQIFVPLSTGGALAVHPDPRLLAAHEILAFAERCGVTVLDLPAALWRQWVEEVAASRLPLPPALRSFLTGGESVSQAKLRAWAGLTDRPVDFLSSYGPTEATVTSTVFVTTNERAGDLARPNVPIGRPLPNVRCHVLDRWMQPVPRGVPGDLYLAGAGLARGYLGRPALTADAFRPDPLASWVAADPGGRLYRTGDLARYLPDGDLEFLGRADHQVKVRGFRIEIGEIETALATHPAVRQGVVAVREDTPGDRRLAAYLVAEPRPDAAELRVLLARRLPDYMIPSSFTFLERLPVLPTGKVDRAALPAPDLSAEASGRLRTPPRNAVEEVLARLFASVLRLDNVGIEEDFFALGGHSLLAAQLAGQVRDTLETEIELRLLFEAPTVGGLAELLLREPAERARLERVAEVTLEIARLGDAEIEAMLASEETR
jgi:amino acid adenylation domain-containing protein